MFDALKEIYYNIFGYLVDTLCFRPLYCFLLLYISSLIMGIVIYALTKHYGVEWVEKYTSKKVYEKYAKFRSNTKKCEVLLIVTLLLPYLPDNAVSCIVSLSDIKFKRYLIIYVLCKPLKLLVYAYGYSTIFSLLKGYFY